LGVVRIPAGDGLTLVAGEFGRGGDPVVLLAHGGGQCRHVWTETAERLAAARYHVYALDSRGHGDSERPATPRYEMEDLARDFEAVARWSLAREGRPPHYVGASFSGLAGLVAAGRINQDVFASLTLVDVTPTYDESVVLKSRAFFIRTAKEGFSTEAEAARALGLKSGNPNVGKMMRQEADGRWYWRWDPAFAECIHFNQPTQNLCQAAAAAVSLPIHLIRAGRSEFVTDDTTAAFLALTPHLQVTVLPDHRHVVSGDPDGVYANAMLSFLERVSGRA
jgi:pimeloyl-ACP methyl ester carboxylesterase